MSSLPNGLPRRIATLSVHTSPLDQPGTGDAGGLNVYVVQVAKRLAARGTEVEIFTRAVCRDTPPLAELAPGVLVRSVAAGPFEELDKHDLPAQVCQFTHEVLRAEAAAEPGRYDLVHAHYWLSGKVGAAAKERWGVPLVQSMHTLGKVKNAALAAGDAAEPETRIRGELEVVAAADRLIANTAEEARQLTELYGADPAKVQTINPGADLSVFDPGGPQGRAEARRRLGIAPDAVVLLFVGRLQPLKGPDVALKAAARLLETDPDLRDTLQVVIVGGPSGRQERADPDRMRDLAARLGISDRVRFEPARGQDAADHFGQRQALGDGEPHAVVARALAPALAAERPVDAQERRDRGRVLRCQRHDVCLSRPVDSLIANTRPIRPPRSMFLKESRSARPRGCRAESVLSASAQTRSSWSCARGYAARR